MPEPEGPTRLTNWPSLDGEAHAFEDRLPAIGNRQIADAQLQPPTIVVSCSPDMLAPDLMQAAGDQALLDALGRVEVDVHRFRDRASRGDAR